MAAGDAQGQRHDRIELIHGQGDRGYPPVPAPHSGPPRSGVNVDTSIAQKMMSATIGSLMTSLLGMNVKE